MKNYTLWIKKFLKDKNSVLGLTIIIILVIIAIFGKSIAPYSSNYVNPKNRLQPPTLEHFMGTDHMGRDMFSRILLGTRLSLSIAITAITASLIVGCLWGLVAGYYEGWLGIILMRIADMFVALPRIVMALVISAALGPGVRNTIWALSITYWPFWTRVVYADVVHIKKSPFIEATASLGASKARVIFLHILPNIAPGIIIRTTISLGGTIIQSALLSFVGLGAQPPTPDWGLDLAISRSYLPTAWWFAFFPGLTILITAMAFNLVGDSLRDIIDPTLRISRESGV